jgi:signal transduction histidine kinase
MESIATHDEKGNSNWIQSAVMDITERKKKEQTLVESEERLRLVSLQLLNAQEEERKRIASEMHDTLGSSLSAINFKAEAALDQIQKAPGALAEALNSLIPMVHDCIDECRRTAGFLGLGNGMKRKSRLAARFGPKDFHHASFGESAHPECGIQ